jgi:hypothetical protein
MEAHTTKPPASTGLAGGFVRLRRRIRRRRDSNPQRLAPAAFRGSPGDTVEHTPGAVRINARELPLSATRTHDSRGLPVPVADYGLFVLGKGEFWVYSPYHDGSFDSRYVGVVGQDQLRGTMRPVVTWCTREQRGALRVRGMLTRRCGHVARVHRVRGSQVA